MPNDLSALEKVLKFKMQGFFSEMLHPNVHVLPKTKFICTEHNIHVTYCVFLHACIEVNKPHETSVDETMWITLKTTSNDKNLSIAVIYGKQESTNIQEVERHYQELTTEINQQKKKNHIMVMGDFNAKIKIQQQQPQTEPITQRKTPTATNAPDKHT